MSRTLEEAFQLEIHPTISWMSLSHDARRTYATRYCMRCWRFEATCRCPGGPTKLSPAAVEKAVRGEAVKVALMPHHILDTTSGLCAACGRAWRTDEVCPARPSLTAFDIATLIAEASK